MTITVAVLLGGLSKEREVSLNSGKAVAKALSTIGYNIVTIDPVQNLIPQLEHHQPDVVFNALHGTYGEDGCIPGLLEILNIPYTHSGVMASAAAFYKPFTKQILQQAGITMPKGIVLPIDQLYQIIQDGKDPLPRPYVVKPVSEGSSLGVYIIHEQTDPSIISQEWCYGNEAIVESYIPGKELSVAVLEGKPLGIMEIRPVDGVYDYANKYQSGTTEYIVPAPIHPQAYDAIMDMATKADAILHCHGLSRSDFRYNEQEGDYGTAYLMEVNTHPGMTDLSIVPKIAATQGINFTDLVDRLVQEALQSHRHKTNQQMTHAIHKKQEQAVTTPS